MSTTHRSLVETLFGLEGRVALVTGGMGGLGEAICIKLAGLGYKVVTTYSPGNTKAAEWLDTMNKQGYGFRAYGCDVADYDSAAACVQKVTAEVGPIDVLVNNAGITRDMTFKKMDKVNWDAVLRTNLDSLFNMSKQVVDAMSDRGWGRVINVSSVNGSKGAFGQTNYSAAKAGIVGMTKAASKELAHLGVRVNAIQPGLIRSAMTEAMPQRIWDSKVAEVPLGRAGEPSEVANVALFLASDLSSYMTGTVLEVTGGRHL